MGLSCECDDGGEWWYRVQDEFSTLQTKRARRCSSCNTLIKVGDVVLKFYISRPPTEFEIETIGICEGDEVPKAPKYLCEPCGDLYLSLDDLGFCNIAPDESMTELLDEYHENYGSKAA